VHDRKTEAAPRRAFVQAGTALERTFMRRRIDARPVIFDREHRQQRRLTTSDIPARAGSISRRF
jgi:hypothetical protein